MQTVFALPPVPAVGYPEAFYTQRIHSAKEQGNIHLRESLKVAQYITLAMNPDLAWPQKQRYFEHALHRHCTPPPAAERKVLDFYNLLRDLVKQKAGEQAIAIASRADDGFAARIARGESRDSVRQAANAFFGQIVGDTHRTPDYFNFDDWHQLMVLRGAWH